MSGMKLEPCLCGGFVRVFQLSTDAFQCQCGVCGMKGGIGTLKEAIDSWNAAVSEPGSFLKPCPFCNGEARLRRVDFPDGDVEWVFDCQCGRKIFDKGGKAEAIEAWNRRAS